MSEREAENERVMREYTRAWNDHDVATMLELRADEMRAADDEYSPDELRAICDEWFGAFPDLSLKLNDLASDGDRVLGYATLTGTHEGEFWGLEPTGRHIEIADHFSTRLRDGRIVEHDSSADVYGLLRQIGVTLPPESTTEDDSKAVVRRYFDALDGGDWTEIAAITDTGDRDHHPALDFSYDVHGVYADGDVVTTRLTVRDPTGDSPATDSETDESSETTTTVCRVADGRIVEWWATVDGVDFPPTRKDAG